MEPLFAKVSTVLDFPAEEREILRFWKAARIFEKTLSKPAKRGTFVFYEGPPTANGLPHNGHVLTRVIKDLFPRYKTMRGWTVPRKAGWDTHGLPVEVEVEKELRIHGKAAIVEYGVEPFIRKCLESVFRYTREWEEMTERVAFWVDLNDAYVTYHRSYIESVWWALSELFKKGLLYQGHKVVWWWAQGGTALSAGEVGLGYRSVEDPSVYVAFRVAGDEKDLFLLVWTTTPWTLPSNMYAAVHEDLEYVVARAKDGRRFVVAKLLRESLEKKLGTLRVEREMKGSDIQGWEYEPPFDLFRSAQKQVHSRAGIASQAAYWRVVLANFVTLDAGTGIVHIAPAFGEDDHRLFVAEQASLSPQTPEAALELFCAVKPDGTFIDSFDRYSGRWVKDCDKEIQHDLRDKGLLVHAESFRHDYPFCWRAESDPLIQYARPAWYIRTTAVIDRAIANNHEIHWIPEHIKEGRFGDFLAHNVDWALSRERWWGTPLNVWVCESNADHKEVPASIAEIERRNTHAFDHFYAARRIDPSLSDHLIVHKPWIDQVHFPCGTCGATMRRVPEVIDCWFDSGCMPFAQWGYPHQGREQFERSFPADFISEAIDQTRGWFYSLLMVSTLVFEKPYPHPYKTCIVLGHVSDKEGKKESKSRGNYTPPEVILDKVAMDFAIWDPTFVPSAGGAGESLASPAALISREDFEGMDLSEGAVVRIYRIDDPDGRLELPVRADKRVPRRVVVLGEEYRAKLGVLPCAAKDIKPVDVPWLPREERVTVEDPSTHAPGADAFRWFFYAASPPWSATRHALSNVRALQKEYAIKLRNVYSFFTIYANIDQFRPGAEPVLVETARPEIDRWIRGELMHAVREVTAHMDAYDVFGATQRLVALVDALSNWWVRRSRARFWKSAWDDDKRSAYETLYECLVTIAKLSAPFTPYSAEGMYQNLVVRAGVAGACESVHLEAWPEADGSVNDARLSRKIAAVREIVSLGLRARMESKIKVRQPLRSARVITAERHLLDLDPPTRSQIDEELNVQETRFVPFAEAESFVEFRVKPNFRSLGKRGLGREAQALKKTMGGFASNDAARVASQLMEGLRVTLDGVELGRDDVELECLAKEGFAAAGDRIGVVLLDTRIDAQLRDQGLLRELVNRVQTMRKEMGLEYTDRIRLSIQGGARICALVDTYRGVLANEVLAVDVSTGIPLGTPGGDEIQEIDLEGEQVCIGVTRALGPG
ncbi:MAG: isoleucine--tRNA ligase [Myxococcota bacterium]|nr:isoleucine--tRNA ligase [Myxococcota bacterium]